jgi:hypothetical protein
VVVTPELEGADCQLMAGTLGVWYWGGDAPTGVEHSVGSIPTGSPPPVLYPDREWVLLLSMSLRAIFLYMDLLSLTHIFLSIWSSFPCQFSMSKHQILLCAPRDRMTYECWGEEILAWAYVLWRTPTNLLGIESSVHCIFVCICVGLEFELKPLHLPGTCSIT